MSESPGPGGDAENIIDGKLNRSRPADVDEGIDAVPAKCAKVDEGLEDNIDEEDDDAGALDDEEQDFDEDDDEEVPEEDIDFVEGEEDDEGEAEFAPNEENIFDETGESSTDLDEFIQTNLAYIDDCQTDIDNLNQKANDEILKVEQKFNKLRQPVYSRRNKYIAGIPHFWATVFSRHPQLRRVLTKDDIKCLKFMSNLEVEDFEDSRSGYRIKFSFNQNLWFTNSSITKEYHLPWHDSPSCECTSIHWKAGMNLTKKPSSFFSWFCSQEDASTDDIAEIIKEELWPNPLQSYLMKENGEIEVYDDSSDDDDNEGPVYIDDDEDEDAEYVSSEGSDAEEWKRPAALGKEAPGTSKQETYSVDDDENEDGIDPEDELEEDETADLSSQGNYGFDEDEEPSDLGLEVGGFVPPKKPTEITEDKLEDEDAADIASRGNYGFSEETDLSKDLPVDMEEAEDLLRLKNSENSVNNNNENQSVNKSPQNDHQGLGPDSANSQATKLSNNQLSAASGGSET